MPLTNQPPDDLALLQLQVDALFTHDPDGRIRVTNEPNGVRAARFVLNRSRAGNLWRCRYDVPSEIAQELEHLAAAEPVGDDLHVPPRNADAMRRVLERLGPIEGEFAGPAYHFVNAIAEPSGVDILTPDNAYMLRELWPNDSDLEGEVRERGPCMVIVDQGRAVATCFCARITAHAAEAGVETLPQYRRRGFARAVVTAWALAIQGMGRIPLYSTSWDNLASQGVAGKLGLRMYGVDWSLR